MSDPAPAATFQNSAEDLVKRNAACVETRQARNTWYIFFLFLLWDKMNNV